MRAACLFVALLLCWPAPLRAETPDAANDARLRFEEGQRLYDEGKYDEAIVQYQAAYAAKPHPNVLYNIGQAYERLLNYVEALRYFERYLAESPPTAQFRTIVQNRLRVLRDLPARISVVAVPTTTTATLTGEKGTFRGGTPFIFKVPAGKYTLRLEAPGWEAEQHELEAEIGQPYFYQYRLKRATAQLTVFSKPQKARVFVDNRMVGETPYAGELEVGKHQLLLEHPDYPWYKEEISLLPRAPLRREIKFTRPVRSGRTELIVGAMIYGGVAGPLLVTALAPRSFLQSSGGLGTVIASSAAGLAAGFLGAFLPTKDGVNVGTSSLTLGGAAWGSTLGFALGLSLKLDTKYTLALGLLGSGVGLTSGLLAAKFRKVSAGDAAIVNSSGIWGAATGALLAQAIFKDPSAQNFGWCMIGTTSGGLLIGSLLAWKLERSRGHVALVDAGALVGGGLGFAVGYAVGATSRDNNGLQQGARYGIAGLGLGLVAGAVLAATYRGDAPPPTEALLIHDENRWKLGMPRLSIELNQVDYAKWEPKLSVTVLSGTF